MTDTERPLERQPPVSERDRHRTAWERDEREWLRQHGQELEHGRDHGISL